jgi:hypothetical protein
LKQILGKYRHFWQILSVLLLAAPAAAQIGPRGTAARDTIRPSADSAVVSLEGVRVAESVDAPVEYGARDSMWFDLVGKRLHLYGQAFVKYTSLDVRAGYIVLDYTKNEIEAQELPDSSGALTGLPEFKDGEQTFTAQRLRYNFKTQKGIVYEARTQQEDLFVLGERAKFIGAGEQDTVRSNNTIYNKDAIITTCDALHPHFGIHTQKLKVVPDKLVVTGLSNLEIAGVPTPLVLPFGFYPITQTRKAGLIIPRDFEFADAEGLGIKNFGWYQPISDHMDVTGTFNIYTSGSFGAQVTSRYIRSYRDDGNFEIRFNNRVTEDEFAQKVSAKSFGLRWAHQQSPKAHPTRKFGGAVNLETNRDQNRNRNDYQSVYQNQLNSNLTYSQTFPGKPYQFNAAFQHTQNTQTRQMDITLPSATFTLQRVFPFKRKEAVGRERWYERISVNYTSQLRNQVHVADTLLFTRETLRNLRVGVQHRASTDYNFKLFKYINIAPTLSYEENWYPYTVEREILDEDVVVLKKVVIPVGDRMDTIQVVDSTLSQFGRDTTYRDYGFKAFRSYNAGLSANTALFFTRQFRQGWFRGFRHTVKPSVSVGFGPDFDRYFRTVRVPSRLRDIYPEPESYSIFEEGIFGRPSQSNRDIVLSYSLANVLEIKHFARRDSTSKKVRIFDNLVFSGSYNLSADTLQWSAINTGGLFRLFKGLSVLTWNATFDPYIANERGQRINRYSVREQGRLLRTTRLSFALNTTFSIGDLRKRLTSLGRGGDDDDSPASDAGTTRPRTASSDDFVTWLEDFRITHRISLDRTLIPTGIGTSRDTFQIGSNNLSLSGSIPLSSKWSLDIGNISYDFKSKSMVYPDLGISRDLHCWEFSLSWQPLRGTYLFSINVRPGSSLDFLKVPYRKNNIDARLSF